MVEKQCWHCRIIMIGKSESEHRKQVDNNNPKRLFYRNKITFSFNKYVKNTKKTFNVLKNYNVDLYEEYNFRKLLDNINFPNNYLKNEVNICRSSHSASFETASKYLSTVISRLLPATHPSPGRYGWRQQVNSAGIGRRGGRGGQFEVRGGRGRGG